MLEYTFKEAPVKSYVFFSFTETMEGRYIGNYTTTKAESFGGPAVTTKTYLNDFGEDIHGKTWLVQASADFESPGDNRGVTCSMNTIHHRFPFFGHETERSPESPTHSPLPFESVS